MLVMLMFNSIKKLTKLNSDAAQSKNQDLRCVAENYLILYKISVKYTKIYQTEMMYMNTNVEYLKTP